LATAEILLLTFSFRMQLQTWKFTVRSERHKILPTSDAVFPSADHLSTSISLGDKWHFCVVAVVSAIFLLASACSL